MFNSFFIFYYLNVNVHVCIHDDFVNDSLIFRNNLVCMFTCTVCFSVSILWRGGGGEISLLATDQHSLTQLVSY